MWNPWFGNHMEIIKVNKFFTDVNHNYSLKTYCYNHWKSKKNNKSTIPLHKSYTDFTHAWHVIVIIIFKLVMVLFLMFHKIKKTKRFSHIWQCDFIRTAFGFIFRMWSLIFHMMSEQFISVDICKFSIHPRTFIVTCTSLLLQKNNNNKKKCLHVHRAIFKKCARCSAAGKKIGKWPLQYGRKI